MNRNARISTWIAAAQAAGFAPEPGCPFYVWADGRERSPLRMIETAPRDVILEACMVGLRLPGNDDKAFFVGLVERHSDSEAVKRWARAA